MFNARFILVFCCIGILSCANNSNTTEQDPVSNLVDADGLQFSEIKLKVNMSIPWENPLRISFGSDKTDVLGVGIKAEKNLNISKYPAAEICKAGKATLDKLSYVSGGSFGEQHKYLELYKIANPYEIYKSQYDYSGYSLLNSYILDYAVNSVGNENLGSIASTVSFNRLIASRSFLKKSDTVCNVKEKSYDKYVSSVAYGLSLTATYRLIFHDSRSIEKWKTENKESVLFSVFRGSSIDPLTVSDMLSKYGLKELSVNVLQIGGKINDTQKEIESLNCSSKNIAGCRLLTNKISDFFNSQLTSDFNVRSLDLLEPLSITTEYLD